MEELAFWLKATLPVLVKTIDWAALQLPGATTPKDAGSGLSTPTPVPPVPVMGNWCGEPLALSFKVNEALRAPVAAGVNLSEYVQDDPAVKGLAQVVETIE